MQFFRLYLPVCALLILPFRETHAQQASLTLESAGRFDGAFAPAVLQGRKIFLHSSGNIVVDKPLSRLRNGGNIARKAGFAGAIDAGGKVMLPFEYDEVDEDYDFHFLILKKNGKTGVADSTGQVRAKPVYDEITALSAGAVAFKRGSQYGWISLADGSVHPSPGRLSRSYVSPEVFYIEQGERKGLLHQNGHLIVPARYDMIFAAYPGTVIYEGNGKAGMMDLQGNALGKQVYESLVYAYDDSVVRAKLGGKTGLLGPAGELSIPAKYTDIGRFTNGQAVVSLNGRYGVTDKSGREIVPLEYDGIKTTDALGREILNYAKKVILKDTFRAYVVTKQGKYGLLAWNGKPLLPLNYTAVGVETLSGRAYVFAQKGGKTALFSQEGKELIPALYDELIPATDANRGFTYYATDAARPAASAMVRAINGDRNGLIGLDGETIVPVRYESLRWESNGLLELKNGDTTTIAAADGKIIRPPAYRRYYYMVAPDRIVEAGENGTRLTDLDGKVLYDLKNWEYNKAKNNIGDSSFFYAGLMKAGDYRETNLFITRDGQEVRFEGYTDVSPFYNGLAVAYKGRKIGFIDSTGKEIIPVQWDDVRHAGSPPKPYKIVTLDDKTGLMDRRGQLLLPVEYDRITESSPGYFLIVKEKLTGLADSTGRIVLQPVYAYIAPNLSINGLMLVKGAKKGLATRTGKILIPAEYDDLELNYGYDAKGWPVMVKQGNTVRYFNENGQLLPVTAQKMLER